MTSLGSRPVTEIFDAEYYRTGLGPTAYNRENRELVDFFARIAEELIRALHPKTVMDAGCAMGFLVEAFWDRGIEAHGIDVSSYAISQVRRDMGPFCRVGSLTEPLAGHYDLITCIEVLEHMPDEEARNAIRNLTQATDTILFSSSPTDLSEKTHINVKQPIAWLGLFAAESFFPDLMFDSTFVAPQAMLLRRSDRQLPWDVLRLFSELIRYKNALLTRDVQNQPQGAQVTLDVITIQEHLNRLSAELTEQRSVLAELQHALTSDFLDERLRSLSNARYETIDSILEGIQRELDSLAARNGVLIAELEQSERCWETVRREMLAFRHQAESQSRILSEELEKLRREMAVENTQQMERIQSVQRRIGSLEVTAWESHTQIAEILQSRIWKTLVRLGGAMLRVLPRSK